MVMYTLLCERGETGKGAKDTNKGLEQVDDPLKVSSCL